MTVTVGVRAALQSFLVGLFVPKIKLRERDHDRDHDRDRVHPH